MSLNAWLQKEADRQAKEKQKRDSTTPGFLGVPLDKKAASDTVSKSTKKGASVPKVSNLPSLAQLEAGQINASTKRQLGDYSGIAPEPKTPDRKIDPMVATQLGISATRKGPLSETERRQKNPFTIEGAMYLFDMLEYGTPTYGTPSYNTKDRRAFASAVQHLSEKGMAAPDQMLSATWDLVWKKAQENGQLASPRKKLEWAQQMMVDLGLVAATRAKNLKPGFDPNDSLFPKDGRTWWQKSWDSAKDLATGKTFTDPLQGVQEGGTPSFLQPADFERAAEEVRKLRRSGALAVMNDPESLNEALRTSGLAEEDNRAIRAILKDMPDIAANSGGFDTYMKAVQGVVNPFTTATQLSGTATSDLSNLGKIGVTAGDFMAQLVVGGWASGAAEAAQAGKYASAALRYLSIDNLMDAPDLYESVMHRDGDLVSGSVDFTVALANQFNPTVLFDSDKQIEEKVITGLTLLTFGGGGLYAKAQQKRILGKVKTAPNYEKIMERGGWGGLDNRYSEAGQTLAAQLKKDLGIDPNKMSEQDKVFADMIDKHALQIAGQSQHIFGNTQAGIDAVRDARPSAEQLRQMMAGSAGIAKGVRLKAERMQEQQVNSKLINQIQDAQLAVRGLPPVDADVQGEVAPDAGSGQSSPQIDPLTGNPVGAGQASALFMPQADPNYDATEQGAINVGDLDPVTGEPVAAESQEQSPTKAFHAGEEIEYTGNTQEIHGGTFYEFKYLTGPKAGEMGVTQNDPGGKFRADQAEKVKQEFADEQQQFRRLNSEGRAVDGGSIGKGEQFLTSTGRVTTPYPKQKSEKFASQWLIDNAIAEAKARGDEFNLLQFQQINPNKKGGDLIPEDRASMLMYLFDEEFLADYPGLAKKYGEVAPEAKSKGETEEEYSSADRITPIIPDWPESTRNHPEFTDPSNYYLDTQDGQYFWADGKNRRSPFFRSEKGAQEWIAKTLNSPEDLERGIEVTKAMAEFRAKEEAAINSKQARFDELAQKAQDAFDRVTDPSQRMLRPAPIDWLSLEDANEMSELATQLRIEEKARLGNPETRRDIKRFLRNNGIDVPAEASSWSMDRLIAFRDQALSEKQSGTNTAANPKENSTEVEKEERNKQSESSDQAESVKNNLAPTSITVELDADINGNVPAPVEITIQDIIGAKAPIKKILLEGDANKDSRSMKVRDWLKETGKLENPTASDADAVIREVSKHTWISREVIPGKPKWTSLNDNQIFTTNIDGKPAFTNTNYMILGDLPRLPKDHVVNESRVTPDGAKRVWDKSIENATSDAEFIGTDVGIPASILVGQSGEFTLIDPRFVANVMKAYPSAKAKMPSDNSGTAIAFYNDGAPVAIVMPRRISDHKAGAYKAVVSEHLGQTGDPQTKEPGVVEPGDDYNINADTDIADREVEAEVEEAKAEPDIITSAPVDAPTSTPIEDAGEKIGGARKDAINLAISEGKKQVKQAEKRFEILEPTDKDPKFTLIDNKRKRTGGIIGEFDTREEAEFAKKIAIFSDNHGFASDKDHGHYIYRRIGKMRHYRLKTGFESKADAMMYATKNIDELLGIKTILGEGDLVTSPNYARKGPTRRAKGNITPNALVNDFGFRGIEFGNWNNQQDRQDAINAGYDAMADLTEMLGVPLEFMSLGGNLSLAFGARGQGLSGARAHYEPDRMVINLTKEKGFGALAHEWFHALDHYLSMIGRNGEVKWKDGATKTIGVKKGEISTYITNNASEYRHKYLNADVIAALNQFKEAIHNKRVADPEAVKRAEELVNPKQETLKINAEILLRRMEKPEGYMIRKGGSKATPADMKRAKDILDSFAEGNFNPIEQDVSGSGLNASLTFTNPELKELSEIYKKITGRQGIYKDNGGDVGGIGLAARAVERARERMEDAMSTERNERTVSSQFKANARAIDAGRVSIYWADGIEMSARAFEAWVEDQAAESGLQNNYLNYGSNNDHYKGNWLFHVEDQMRPYPEGDERKVIFDATQNLVSAVSKAVNEGTLIGEPRSYYNTTKKNELYKTSARAQRTAESDQGKHLENVIKSLEDIARGQGAVVKFESPLAQEILGKYIKPTKNLPAGEIKLQGGIDRIVLAEALAHEVGHLVDQKITGDAKGDIVKILGAAEVDRKLLTGELTALTKAVVGIDEFKAKQKYYSNPAELWARFIEALIFHPEMAEKHAPTVDKMFSMQGAQIGAFADLMQVAQKGVLEYQGNNFLTKVLEKASNAQVMPDAKQGYIKALGRYRGTKAWRNEKAYQARRGLAMMEAEALLKEKFENVDPKEFEMMFEAAEGVRRGPEGDLQFGTRKWMRLDPTKKEYQNERVGLDADGWWNVGQDENGHEVWETWRMTPGRAKIAYESLSPEAKAVVDEFTADLADAHDLFNRNMLREFMGLEETIEGWVHHFHPDKKPQSGSSAKLKKMKASARKHRTEADGFSKDFFSASLKSVTEAMIEREQNEFIESQFALVVEPIINNEVKDGFVEIQGSVNQGFFLDGERRLMVKPKDSDKLISVTPGQKYQVPKMFYDRYLKNREVDRELKWLERTLTAVGRYMAGNLLIHTGTWVTNHISGGLMFGLKIIRDSILDVTYRDFDLHRTRGNVSAIAKPIQSWKQVPDAVYGGYQNTSLYMMLGPEFDSKGQADLKKLDRVLDKGLRGMSAIEQFWKKTVVMSEIEARKVKNGGEIDLDELFKDKEFLGAVADVADMFTLDYDNANVWLDSFRRSPGSGLVKPFVIYPYKITKHYMRMAGSSLDMNLPWQERVANSLALGTVIVIMAMVKEWRDDEAQGDIDITNIPESVDMDKLNHVVDSRGRLFLYADGEGNEKYLRVAKYPYANIGMALESAFDGDWGSVRDAFRDQFGGLGPGAELGLFMLGGYSDEYSRYKEADVMMAEKAATFIPLGRMLKDASDWADPKVRDWPESPATVFGQYIPSTNEEFLNKWHGTERTIKVPLPSGVKDGQKTTEELTIPKDRTIAPFRMFGGLTTNNVNLDWQTRFIERANENAMNRALEKAQEAFEGDGTPIPEEIQAWKVEKARRSRKRSRNSRSRSR